ncbi:MAG: hypothetical protein ACT4O3_05555 [Elusimicrobiota bacterium]
MMKSKAVLAAVLASSLAMTGCKDGNLFGGLTKKGSGNESSLAADARAALARREYHNAKAYYEAILAKNPRNSEALYGAATATMGTAGLDLGTLISNVINSNGAPGLAPAFNAAKFGVALSHSGVNSNSILHDIELGKLGASIDQIVCFLLKIRAGFADGTISPEDISLLVSVGITCLIRAILRPLEEGVIDLRQTADGKDYEVFIIDPSKLSGICDNGNGILNSSAADFAGGLQAIDTAVKLLKQKDSSTLGQIRLDIRSAFESFQQKMNAEPSLPPACKEFINSFKVDSLAPPTQDPGDCLNKNVEPKH